MNFVLCFFLTALSGVCARGPNFLKLYSNTKIVGGQDVKPGEIPYQVSLQQRRNNLPPFHFCGGSILNDTWVITAAHCVLVDDSSAIQVVAGEHNLNVREGNEQVRNLTRILRHKDYNTATKSNDIALLELDKPLDFNYYVVNVSLPLQNHSSSGNCVVSGWGSLEEGGTLPKTLQKVTVSIASDAACKKSYGSQKIDETMICAGKEGKDSCQGDSGGPLVCREGNESYLAGIVSWGKGCARPDFPGVYTKVSHFIDWINNPSTSSMIANSFGFTVTLVFVKLLI